MDNTETKPSPIRQFLLDPRTLRLSARSIQEWESPDGGGFTCKLYWGGKLAGRVYNDGNGGSSQIDINDPEIRKAVYQYVDSLPWTTPDECFPEGLKRDLDWVVSELLAWAQRIKQFKRWNKKSVCFQVIPATDADIPQSESWSLYPCTDPAVRDAIKQKLRENYGIDGKKLIFTDDFC